jgi:DNA mismatch endonuclease (patch repair protein)
MRATPQRDSPPEVALRSELHRLGLRFRLHRSIEEVPRARPDIVFVVAKVAVFVDGCFWHSCPAHGTQPKRNSRWWAEKLRSNSERDQRLTRNLSEAGWTVLRVWEHEDPAEAARKVAAAVQEARLR